MRGIKRIAASILLPLCLPLFLTCGEGCGYNLKYEITGTAPLGGVEVQFANEYGDDEAFPVKLPWVKEFNIQFRDDTYYGGKFTGGIFPAYVTATIIKYGSVTAKIYYNGNLADSATAGGKDGKATARYGVRLR
jgi:hypothetical protein